MYLDYSNDKMIAAYWKLPNSFKYGRLRPRRIITPLSCTECLCQIEAQERDIGFSWLDNIPAITLNWSNGEPSCEYHLPKRQAAIRAILSQWARNSEEWGIRYYWYKRIFYTLKCLMCILLNLKTSPDLGDHWYLEEKIDGVGQYGWQNESGFEAPSYAGSWSDVQVGRGIIRGWYYKIEWESNW